MLLSDTRCHRVSFRETERCEACSGGNPKLRASQTAKRRPTVLPERIVNMRVIVYTSPRSLNEAEMDQLNYTPRETQAEAAPGAVRGIPQWKGRMGLRRD